MLLPLPELEPPDVSSSELDPEYPSSSVPRGTDRSELLLRSLLLLLLLLLLPGRLLEPDRDEPKSLDDLSPMLLSFELPDEPLDELPDEPFDELPDEPLMPSLWSFRRSPIRVPPYI